MEIVNSKSRRGFTLPEMLVSLSIVAIVAGITLPAFYALRNGYNSSGADTIVSAALSSAKAMAAKEQKYAGIRFQCAPNPDDPTKPGDQYLVFIIQDPSLSAYGFRAARGVAPIKLPVNQGAMDMSGIAVDTDISSVDQLWNATTFSIVFSPSGRLVTHDVRVWNMEGKSDDSGTDMVFNTYNNVSGAIKGTPPVPPTQTWKGMFYQDGETIPPPPATVATLTQEPSRKSIVVFDRREFDKAYKSGKPYSDCLGKLTTGDNNQVLYINPYTGTIVENQNRRNAAR